VRGASRSFIFRYSESGRRRDLSIGSVKKVALTDAKAKAQEIRVRLNKGMPLEEKAEPPKKEVRFEDFARETIETIGRVSKWKNEKHAKQWMSTIRQYAFPLIGNKDVSSLTRGDILAVLFPIWHEIPETAGRVRGRLEKILSYAVSEGLIQFNPALWKGNLDMFLPPIKKVQAKGHFGAMSLEDLKAFAPTLLPAKNVTRLALLLGILTATRAGEFTQAEWKEFDLESAVWTIPAERRKDGKAEAFRVPLSHQLVEILSAAERSGTFVLASAKGRAISRETPRILLQRITKRNDITMHGMRSTFRNWCAESGVQDTVAETCLMHSVGNQVVQAYLRSDLLDQRRAVMQAWADTVLGTISP
jgi:integrase